jgi:small conductance mechanosensitive channel
VSSAIDIPLAGLDLTVSNVLWAAAAALVTAAVARYSARATLRLGHRVQGIRDDLALQGSRVVRYFVITMGIGVVLAILGAPIQPLLAAFLLVAAAAFLMLRGIADNFGAGLVIQTRHPVRLGDLVESCGHRGHVADLNSRSVVIADPDGRTVHIPNRQFMDEPLVNWSTRGQARSELQVRVSLDTANGPDVAARVAELEQTALAVRGVLTTPAPHALLTGADPDRLVFTLLVWHRPDAGRQVCSRVAIAIQQGPDGARRATAVAWPPPPAPLTRSGDV